MHSTEAEARATDAFALYRQAMGESTSPSATEAIDATTAAKQLTSEARTSLGVAREAIASYIAHISPGAAPGSKVIAQIAPDGEKLLDLSRRPRNMKEFQAEAIRNIADSANVVDSSASGVKQAVVLFRPPEITGAHSVVEIHGTPTSQSPLPTDNLGAIIISGTIGAQAVIYLGRRVFRSSAGWVVKQWKKM